MKMRWRILEVAVTSLVAATTLAPLAHAQDNLRDGAPFNVLNFLLAGSSWERLLSTR